MTLAQFSEIGFFVQTSRIEVKGYFVWLSMTHAKPGTEIFKNPIRDPRTEKWDAGQRIFLKSGLGGPVQ